MFQSICKYPAQTANAFLWTLSWTGLLEWRFTYADGTIVPTSTTALVDTRIFLAYDKQNGWHLFDPVPDLHAPGSTLFVADTGTAICHKSIDPVITIHGLDKQVIWWPQSYIDLDGCYTVLHQAKGDYRDDYSKLIARFGVALAADDIAHERFPELPIASQEEITAAGG